jgi:hypothetical protein
MKPYVVILALFFFGISSALAKPYTFQYDRDKKDEFHGLSMTGSCDNDRGWCDWDFSLKGNADRAAFYYCRNLVAWLKSHPKMKIEKATLRGLVDTTDKKFTPGPIEYAAMVYDISINLPVWGEKIPDAEKTEWIDWKFKPGKDMLANYQSPVKITGSINAAPGTLWYEFDITALVQYVQKNPSLPWGFIFISTGGTGRVILGSEEDYPTERVKNAGENMMVVIEGK